MSNLDLSSLAPERLRRYLQYIGNTPLSLIELIYRNGQARTVYLKRESFNPGGSVKDRTALFNLSYLEARGTIKPDSILIDSSSGNGAYGYAWICAAKNYRFEAVIDPKTSPEVADRIRAFGAATHLVKDKDDMGGYLLNRIRFCHERCAADPRYVFLNQYFNAGNPAAHSTTTGPEILRDMPHPLDAIFVAASTGGTLAGIGRFMRIYSPRTHIVGVDARGSVIFGGPSGERLLTGIGASRTSSFLTPDVYDESVIVTDEEAFMFSRTLRDVTGIGVGGSSGAVLAACARTLPFHPEWRNVLCLCPDSDSNYTSTVFNSKWLHGKGLYLTPDHLGDVVDFIAVPRRPLFNIPDALRTA